MKKINFAIKLGGILIVYWIVYNTYFGWNMYPETEMELNFDNVFKYGMYFCVWVYFLPLWDAYQKFIKDYVG
ncbi:hypothetical protein ACFQ5N_02250 [Lutibacter holmesii]|uniref:DUF4234 domain-containing protein n=1 Tax=Lutibacter holmesii TaxID=1137985 RepID=A0ABW3WK17_9FLAO